MSEPASVGFILQTGSERERKIEREEKDELNRVIRDCFHPHHKDRSQPGSFTMSASVSTVADGHKTKIPAKMEGPLTKLLKKKKKRCTMLV